MLNLDRSIHPDPFNPVQGDAYGDDDAPYSCIIADIDAATQQVMVCRLGVFTVMPCIRLPVFLRSLGIQPQGRMVAPAKKPSAVDPPRWIEEMGFGLRKLREAHGIRLGELARTLGCPVQNLSAFELGETVGAPQPLGTAEMDQTTRTPLIDGAVLGLMQEALNLLDSAAAEDDQHHVGECINDARKMLIKAIDEVKP